MAEPTPVDSSRYSLADRLETQSGNLSGKKRKRNLEFVDDKSICKTCSRASIYRRSSQNVSVIVCTAFGPVPNDIEECNKYQGITELSLNQMVDMATLLDQRDLLKDSYR